MEDLVGSQNFFGVNALDSRQDAGMGLLLFGNGDGTFTASLPASSGIAIRGEGRGLAVADFDHDGDLDIYALGENSNFFWRNNLFFISN